MRIIMRSEYVYGGDDIDQPASFQDPPRLRLKIVPVPPNVVSYRPVRL